jgi:hypothetical protein
MVNTALTPRPKNITRQFKGMQVAQLFAVVANTAKDVNDIVDQCNCMTFSG